MTDFYLKFASEEEARTVLYTVTPAVTDEDGTVLAEESIKPNYANIDVIGVIYNNDAFIVEEEEVISATAKEGWHVNVRVVGGENSDALQAYSVVPTQPRRIWG